MYNVISSELGCRFGLHVEFFTKYEVFCRVLEIIATLQALCSNIRQDTSLGKVTVFNAQCRDVCIVHQDFSLGCSKPTYVVIRTDGPVIQTEPFSALYLLSMT